MKASEMNKERLRDLFRVAFRLGEERAEKRHANPPATLRAIDRYATNAEIDHEGSFVIDNVMSGQSDIIPLVDVVSFPRPRLVQDGTHSMPSSEGWKGIE